MSRYPFTFELKTERGIPFASVDAEIECELGRAGSVVINGVFIGKENLFNGETLHRSLACAIAGEAETSQHIIDTLNEEAEQARMERRAYG